MQFFLLPVKKEGGFFMNNRTRMLVEAGLMIAIAQVLSYVVIFESPQGGSITAGSMVPIIIFAIRWGTKPGLLAGAVYGVLQFILGPKWSFHPVSLLLYYPVAFACLGLAGLWRESRWTIGLGIALAIFGRFVSHLISGVVVFASYAEGQNPWIYSAVYNASYLVPELIISLVITMVIYSFMKPYFTDQIQSVDNTKLDN